MLKQSQRMALLVWFSLALAVPAAAQIPPDVALPDTKNMPDAFSIIERTSPSVSSVPETVDNAFTKHIKTLMETHGFIPNADRMSVFETARRPVWMTEDAIRRKHGSGPQVVRARTGPEIVTFYDESGRLRTLVPDAGRPGKFRVQDSPAMDELRQLTRGFIDWDRERVELAKQLDDLPLVRLKKIQEKTDRENGDATATFLTRNDITLTVPSPVEMQKEAMLQGKISGDVAPPIQLIWWVDGKQAGKKTLDRPGFSIPLTFATMGRHLFKVAVVDAKEKTRSRSIYIPVTFNVTARTKSSSKDGGRLSVLVTITGGNSSYSITWTSSDGQSYKTSVKRNVVVQRFPNPGLNSISWVKAVVTDTESGIAVPVRVNVARLSNVKPANPCDDPAYRAGRQGAFCNEVSSVNNTDNQEFGSQETPDQGLVTMPKPADTRTTNTEDATGSLASPTLSLSRTYRGHAEGKTYSAIFPDTVVRVVRDTQLEFTINGADLTGQFSGVVDMTRDGGNLFAFDCQSSGSHDAAGKVNLALDCTNPNEPGTRFIGAMAGHKDSEGFKGTWYFEMNIAGGDWVVSPQ